MDFFLKIIYNHILDMLHTHTFIYELILLSVIFELESKLLILF